METFLNNKPTQIKILGYASFAFLLLSMASAQSTTKETDSANTLLRKANLFLDNEKPQKANQTFDKILNSNPKNEKALQGKAEALEMLGQWEQASAQYKLLNGIKPFDYANLIRWNHVLSKTEDSEAQLEVLKILFDQNSSDLNIAIQLLRLFESEGLEPTSPEHFKLLEKISAIPNSADFLAEKLGSAQLKKLAESNRRKQLNEFKRDAFWIKIEAITKWQTTSIDTMAFQQKLYGLIFRYPEEDKLKEAQAILYYVQEQYDHARPLIKHLDKNNLNGIRLRGHLYFLNEQFGLAASQLDKIPRAKITQIEWERLCDSLLSSKQNTKADKEFKNLLKRYPDSKVALSYLAGSKP